MWHSGSLSGVAEGTGTVSSRYQYEKDTGVHECNCYDAVMTLFSGLSSRGLRIVALAKPNYQVKLTLVTLVVRATLIATLIGIRKRMRFEIVMNHDRPQFKVLFGPFFPGPSFLVSTFASLTSASETRSSAPTTICLRR